MSTAVQIRQADAEADAAARAEFQREQAPPSPTELLITPDGRPTAAGWRKIGELLRKQLPSKTFKGRGGKQFSYITARQVAQRLDEVVGPGSWATQVQVIRGEHPVAVLVGLGIFGVWKWDAGYSNNPEADAETDKSFEDEPLKAGVSDGLKRAAVLWGLGRWLYGDL
jgi:hypothetical protein